MRNGTTLAIIASISVLMSGCGSSSDESTNRQPEPPPPDPAPVNPGAIPCGNLQTNYAGDELCILPPDPSLGLQLHVGPTDYNDPAQLAEFELAPGAELTRCYYLTAPNDETFNFFEQQYRMRPGSHHLIMHMSGASGSHPDGWDTCSGGDFIPIGGTQRSVSEFPIDGVVAPEDANLYRPLLPHAQMKFELHFVNTTPEPILREVWVNLMKKEVTPESKILGGVFMIGGIRMRVEPHTQQTLNYQCVQDLPERRVVSIFGHRHAHTTRFSVWAHRAGVRELVYEDYDWAEPLEIQYNTLVKNATPDPTTQTGGGLSGLLNFAQGDRLEWECEINNTSDGVLTFRNEVYTGEMCNVFGSSVGQSTFWSCTPERNPPPPPAP